MKDATRVTLVGNVTIETGGELRFASDFVVAFPVHVAANDCVVMRNMQSYPCESTTKTLPRHGEAVGLF